MATIPFNETPYGYRLLPAKLVPKDPLLSIAVTGLFRLVPDGVCVPLPDDQQTGPANAEAHEDELGNSRMFDSDLQPMKPNAECLLIGSAHAPNGKPVPALSVVFGVGPMRKELSVYGNRRWLRVNGDDFRLDGPDPFVEMPIRNEFAHGGHRSEFNKHGKGFAALGEEAGSTLAVANIMPPRVTCHQWNQDVEPAGFGVLEPSLKPRIDFAGTYDETWQYTRRPLPPKDLDARYFCGARLDQHMPEFLRGDEPLYLQNLHPEIPVINSQLPGERVRIFVDRRTGPGEADLQFAEVPCHLDTCLVDMPSETVRLTWRGVLHVATDDFREIEHVLIGREAIGANLPVASYADILHARLLEMFPPPPDPMTDEARAELDQLQADGMRDIVKALEEGEADPGLIAEIKTKKTVEEALPLMQAWLQKIGASLPKPK